MSASSCKVWIVRAICWFSGVIPHFLVVLCKVWILRVICGFLGLISLLLAMQSLDHQ